MNLRRLLAWQPFSPAVFLTAAAVALILVAAIVHGIWTHNAKTAVEAKVGAAMGKARGEAASEATNIVAAGAERDAATDAITRENSDAISREPGAAQAVDPGLSRAALLGLCRRPSYRDTPECLQLSRSGQLPSANSRR
jgi:hypothetical protein